MRTVWIITLRRDERTSEAAAAAAGNTTVASNKNNCPCSNNQCVNYSSLQDGGGNKGLGMTLFTSADCFKKRRESRASLPAVSGERENERDETREKSARRGERKRRMEHKEGRTRAEGWGVGERVFLHLSSKTPLQKRARLHYWSGLKSILEAIVCNSNEKAAR